MSSFETNKLLLDVVCNSLELLVYLLTVNIYLIVFTSFNMQQPPSNSRTQL